MTTSAPHTSIETAPGGGQLTRDYRGHRFLPEDQSSTGDASLDNYGPAKLSQRMREHGKRYPSKPLVLGSDEIRLLHLLPGAWDDGIRCHLETVRLEDKPQYEAISYTWGASNNNCTVEVDSFRDFPVTDNVFSALRRFRYTDRGRVLWVDSIVINQGLVEERQQQVSIMGQIYSASQRCLIWLGEHPDPQPQTISLAGASGPRPRYAAGHEVVLETLDYIYHNNYPLWWDRVWVVQEAVLAPIVKVCFACYEATWGDFCWELLRVGSVEQTFRGNMNAYPATTATTSKYPIYHSMTTPFSNINYRRTIMREGIAKQPLHVFVESMITLMCSDRRDKIFSVLSLIDPAEADKIEPDYTRPWVEVFARATYVSISVQQRFDIWLNARLLRDDELHLHLPTWAVDFDQLISSTGHNIESIGLSRWSAWSEDEKSFRVTLSPSAERLSVHGYKFNTISAKQDLVNLQMNDPLPQPILQRICTSVLEDTVYQAYNSVGFDMDSQHSSTSIISSSNEQVLELSCGETRLGSQRSAVESLYLTFALWVAATNTTPEQQARILDIPFLEGDIRQFWKYCARASGDATYIQTSNGFIGLAPSSAKVGDHVVLLHGCKFPVLLREKEYGLFTFQGLSYINGIMYDELKLLDQSDALWEQPFVLC